MKLLVATLAFMTISFWGNAMIETLSTANLAHGADLIVLADVIAVKSVGLKENKLEVIANLAKVNEPLKGGAAVGEELKIKTWRGIEDSVFLKEGSRVLLFLRKKDGHYTVFNGPQGCWPIDEKGNFSGMGHGITLEQVKDAISSPPPVISTHTPVMF